MLMRKFKKSALPSLICNTTKTWSISSTLFVLNWFSDQKKIRDSSQKTTDEPEKRDERGGKDLQSYTKYGERNWLVH